MFKDAGVSGNSQSVVTESLVFQFFMAFQLFIRGWSVQCISSGAPQEVCKLCRTAPVRRPARPMLNRTTVVHPLYIRSAPEPPIASTKHPDHLQGLTPWIEIERGRNRGTAHGADAAENLRHPRGP